MRARQKVSRAGVELIKSFEGLRSVAARLPDGRWTLGYGHTFSAREGARVTQEDADALLRFDLLPIVDTINNLILVPINQNPVRRPGVVLLQYRRR
ncbi:MAG: lysozyme [Asticcacaulis sp.]